MAMNVYAPLSTMQSLLQDQLNASRVNFQLQQVNQEVSTGLKANIFADLGQTAAIPMQLQAQMDQVDALSSANTLLGNKMNVISTALGSVHDTAQTVLAQAVSNLGTPGAGL